MTHAGLPPDPHDERGLERVVFFSDAVFAIAITLLVIDLRLPDLPSSATNADVAAALAALAPRLVAYVLSFAVIGLYWMAHWRRFHYIARVDERFLALNLVLLGFIAFIPFPTSLQGEHGNVPIVVAIYALTLAVSGFLGAASWVYAVRAGLTRPDMTPTDVRLGLYRGLSGPAVFLGSLVLLPIGPYAVEAAWLLIFPVQAVLVRLARRPEEPAASP